MAFTPVTDYTAGQTLSAANLNTNLRDNMNHVPRGVLSYVENTTLNQAASADADVTSLSVSATVAASRRTKVTAYIPSVERNGAINITVALYEGANIVNYARWDATNIVTPCCIVAYRNNLAAGSYTYKLRIVKQAGTYGTFTVRSVDATSGAAFILVEDIGAA